MKALNDSLVIASVTKRIPKKKQYKLLMSLRDRTINEITQAVKSNKTHVPTGKVITVYQMNQRILSRLSREDEQEMKQSQTQLFMYTTNRTVVEFKQYGQSIRSTFTGTIEQAKDNLKRGRGVKVIQWAHWFMDDRELLSGMWSDMVVVYKDVTIQ